MQWKRLLSKCNCRQIRFQTPTRRTPDSKNCTVLQWRQLLSTCSSNTACEDASLSIYLSIDLSFVFKLRLAEPLTQRIAQFCNGDSCCQHAAATQHVKMLVYLSTHRSIHLSIYISLYLSTLLSSAKARACHKKPPAERPRPRDTGGTPGHTSDPFAVHQVPRLPRLCSAPSPTPATQKPPAERRRPRDTGGTPGRTGRAAETKGHRRDARAYIRPLCSAPSPTPATQKPPAERRRPRDTGGTPGRTSDPFAVHQVPRLPRKIHRQSGGDQGTCTFDPFAVHQVPRLPRKSHRQSGGHPFAVQQVPRLPRKSHRESGGDQRTPEGRQRTSDPFAVHQVQRLPRKSHRQGVHPTPLQCTKSRACHAKSTGRAAETKGHRRDARAYIRPLCSAPSPAPATQKPPAERRRPRDTGGTPGRTSDPFAVHQVPRRPRKSHWQSGGDQGTPEGRQGVHPTPLQCTKSRAE